MQNEMLHLVDQRIPDLYVDFQIDDLVGSGNVEDIKEQIKEYTKDLLEVKRTGRNLFIYSIANGNGKTSSGYSVLKLFQGPRLDETGKPELYKIAACQFGNYLKFCKDFEEKAAKKAIETAPFLLLDDVSSWAASKSEHQDKLELILLMTYRRQHLLPTIITSNLTPELFNKFFGATANSKVLENFQHIRIEGDDMRPIIYGGEDNGKEESKEEVAQNS